MSEEKFDKQWNNDTFLLPNQLEEGKRKQLWIRKPIYVWREQFLQDRCIHPHQLITELLISAFPHILLNGLLIIYLLMGGVLFGTVDDEIRKNKMSDIVLFAFTTITTIGYGNVAPTNTVSQVACILYCLVGIPLILLVLSNNGQFLTEAYNIWMMSYHKQKTRFDTLPISATLMLLLVHSLIGGFLFSYWIDSLPFISAVYFSFISIATIGYGDFVPTPENPIEIVIIILYMSVGIIALSTLLSTLSSYLKCIHSIGRTFTNMRDFEVWFGGDVMTLEELVITISKHFQVEPKKLHYVLKDLDKIITSACIEPEVKHIKATNCSMEFTQQQQKPKTLLDRSPTEETQVALHALGVLHHKLKKQGSLRRSTSTQPSSLQSSIRSSVRTTGTSDSEKSREKCEIST